MKRFDESFKSKLVGVDFETIEKSPHTVIGLSRDLKIIYFNEAWLNFAKFNGANSIALLYPLGTSIETAISGTLKNFYINNYKKVLKSMNVWNHIYECSSPNVYRVYSQDVYPLKDGDGLLIVNNIQVECGMDTVMQGVIAVGEEGYRDDTGAIIQCSNCRKTRNPSGHGDWDWVPSLVEHPPIGLHLSVCPSCAANLVKFNSTL